MSASLHLDLLTDEEHVSPSPVRLRVMVPMLSVLAVFGIAVWWALYAFRLHGANSQKAKLEANVAGLKSAHAEVVRLRAQEKECVAVLRQLGFYRNARVRFGEAFAQLAEHVPENLQLTEVRVPPPPLQPPPPLVEEKAKAKTSPLLGPTNALETVTLRLAGRAGGESPSEAINTLLEALRTPAFTNLILSAETPKGTFRQDTSVGSSNRDTLLFEITCGCVPRRFE